MSWPEAFVYVGISLITCGSMAAMVITAIRSDHAPTRAARRTEARTDSEEQ